jgi:serine/threonine protein kinase
MADRTGQQLGHYRLVRLLGRGGFAEVYLGEHLHLKTQAAIKVLYTALEEDDIEGFLREAQTVARLKHPHIVRVFDFDVEDHTPYLVMDYLPNGSIRRLYPKGGVLPFSAIVSYVTQIASALQYAHDEKVIHRDVKPENMLLDRDNSLVLSDFGIALMAQSSRYQSAQEVAGTAAYMAPEQFQGHPHLASDQYALGIVVYEWLSGDRPFHGTFSEIASQHLLVPPPPLREKVLAISPDVEQVVTTALSKDPKQRFGSVLAFATALEQASQVKRPEPEPELVVPVSEKTATHQSQQPTEMATPVPVIPFSQHAEHEVSVDTSAQPHTIIPLSGKERLRQVEEEMRRQAEEERALQEKEQADKLEEEQVRKAKDTALAATELAIAAHQTMLPTEVARPSKPPTLRPDAIVAAKPAKPRASRRFVLLGLAGLVIVALASGIAWFTVYHASPAGGTQASPAGSIAEFPVPTAQSDPAEITAGPNGNLWFTEYGGNKIGRISPSGTIIEFPVPTAGSGPGWITAGPDGNLWFTELFSNKIGRISPGGTIAEFPVPTANSVPNGITAGPDGNLWFTEQSGNKIGRISPGGTITEFPVPTAQSDPIGITAGPDGNLWFTEYAGNNIGRITSGK